VIVDFNFHQPLTPSNFLLPRSNASLTPLDFSTAATRVEFTPTAVQALFGLATQWSLTVDDLCGLLGFSVSPATVNRWKTATPSELNMDQLTRVSRLTNVFRTATIIYGANSSAWLRTPDLGPVMGGRGPLVFMRENGMDGIRWIQEDLETMLGLPGGHRG
jgi:uncharacterized protein (DUF2384 family)